MSKQTEETKWRNSLNNFSETLPQMCLSLSEIPLSLSTLMLSPVNKELIWNEPNICFLSMSQPFVVLVPTCLNHVGDIKFRENNQVTELTHYMLFLWSCVSEIPNAMCNLAHSVSSPSFSSSSFFHNRCSNITITRCQSLIYNSAWKALIQQQMLHKLTLTHILAHLVTAGVDQLLKHLPVNLPCPRRMSWPGGRARLVGKRHEGLANFPQSILVVVELLRLSELLLSTGCVFAAFAVGPSAALCPRAAPVQGLAHQLGRLLQALLDLLKPLACVAHIWGSWESFGPHGLSAQSRHLL